MNPNIAWYGLYIGYNGTRLSGGNATASNLADCFDVRLLHSGNNFTMSTYEWSNSGASTGWNSSFSSTGGRMDRTVTGLSLSVVAVLIEASMARLLAS